MIKKLFLTFLILLTLAPAALAYDNKVSQYVTDLGVCSLNQYDPLFYGKNDTLQSTSYQNFLLDCQMRGLNYGTNNLADVSLNACIRATSGIGQGEFGIKINSPIVIPRGVCPDGTMVISRDGSAGTPVANWNGDTSTKQLSNLYQPMIIFPPNGQTYGRMRLILNSTGSDRGNGWFYGRTWRVASLTKQAGGSGFSGGETCTMANGDSKASAAGATFTCATASAGACTALTFAPTQWATQTGQYFLPPVLQRQQWAVANGWDGHDTIHPQVFDNDTNKYYKTTCSGSGTGLTVSAKWWPDFCSGSAADSDTVSCTATVSGPHGVNAYDGIYGNFAASNGVLADVLVEQSGQSFSSSYGYTTGAVLAGFEVTMPYVQTHKSYYGFEMYGSDSFVNHANDVGSAVQLKMRGGASQHVAYARLDTPVDSINSDAHAMEIDHEAGSSDVRGTVFHNSASAATLGTDQVRFGSDTQISDSTHENSGFIFGPTSISSDGTSGSALTALGCAFTRDTLMIADVSNIATSGSARSQQYTHFLDWGTNCESSNFAIGSISNVSGNLFTGSDPGMGLFIWDTAAAGFALPHSTYLLYTAGAPTSGGSGTGLNKAGKGSLDIDYTNGVLYINTAVSSSPAWQLLQAQANQNRTFQISGVMAVANDLTNWIIMPAAGTWTKFYAVCKSGPTGADLIFDIQKSTNNGSSFTSIWATHSSFKVTVAATAVAGNTTSFDTSTFSAGDVFRIDIDQVGSTLAGSNCTVMGTALY